MAWLKEGEKSHCGICEHCKPLFKSLKVPCPSGYMPERTLCCVLYEDEVWEVNENNFCDYFDRREESSEVKE